MSTVEQRSIYSGPIRRSLDRLDSLVSHLNGRVADLETTTVALRSRADALEARVAELENP